MTMDDIVPGLLESIQHQFDERTKKSAKLKNAAIALKKKEATYLDANGFAIELGEILASIYAKNLTKKVLPDGKMYYNIAERIIQPTMKNNYDLVSGYAGDVQKQLNQAAGLYLKTQIPDMNQDRINGIINRISSEPDFDKIKWMLDEPIVNFSQSIVDDSIKENADFQSRSGLRPKIIRRVSGHACKWCQSLAGSYDYRSAPDDIYRRHERCRCTVEYDPGDGRRQNIWSKIWRRPDKDDKIELRKKAGVDKDKELSKRARAALNKTNMQTQVGKDYYSQFINHLDSLDNPRVKEMFATMADRLDFMKIKDVRAYASGSSVQLSKASFVGSSHQKPFQTVYHELGHAFDTLGTKVLTDSTTYSTGQTKRMKILGQMMDVEIKSTHASGIPSYSLKEAIDNDVWQFINGDLPTLESLGKRPRKKAEKEAWDREYSRIHDQWQKNKKAFLEDYKKLAKEDLATYGALSDMLESTRYFESYPLGVGHGSKYWKDYGKAETEFFAHMTELAANKESAKIMNEVFPNAAKIWEKLVDDILRKVK